MKVGTADITEEIEETAAKRRGLTGGNPPGNNGGGGRNPGDDGGDGGPDSNRPDLERTDPADPNAFIPAKSRVLTTFLLLVVLMTFGGLMGAYIVIATNRSAEWRPFDLPLPVLISTFLIVVSSVSFHLGKMAVDRNDQPGAKKWFVVTTVLGSAFISSQILAWLALRSAGLYMQGNTYAGFFYLLTAVHAVHVIGGIIALGSVLLRNLAPTERLLEITRRQTLAQVVGWYWHFVGVLWIVIFVLLGFWK